MSKSSIGKISWTDLTVPNAEKTKNFYSKVVGWQPENVDMGGYNDFSMKTPHGNEVVAGICHTKGMNKDLPAQWLIYINVEDVYESARACEENGGKIISPPRDLGEYGTFCVIEDPAGAVAALITPKEA